MQPFFFLRVAAGGILAVAAILKTFSLVDHPVAPGFWFETRLFFALAILAECILASWMFAGTAATWLRRAGAMCFATFSLYAASKWMVGEESCGCFGSVAVHPLITAAIDLVFLAGFLLVPLPAGVALPPAEGVQSEVDRRVVAVSRALFAVGGTAGVLLSFLVLLRAPAILPIEQGNPLPESGLIVLDPEAWTGETFPLFSYIENSTALQTGEWWVALYSHSCGHCLEMLPRLEDATASRQIAVLSVPPHAAVDDLILPAGGSLAALRLTSSRDWFAATPMLLRLEDGVVVETADRASVDAEITSWITLDGS